MALTSEERAEINRQNARKSSGPKTVEGKNASRANALKHGLRAEVVALPNEDAEAVRARAEEWNDYYRPRSPAARHLVNQCVSATLLADRVNAYHDAVLAKQVRDAQPGYDEAKAHEVDRFVGMLRDNPACAVTGLSRTARGCRLLIERWESLESVCREHGTLPGHGIDELMELQGFHPESSTPTPQAWLTLFFTFLSRETYSQATIAGLFESPRFPMIFQGVYRPNALPSRAFCQARLLQIIVEHLAALRAREAELHSVHESADRDEAPARALTLTDPNAARLFLRYHAEARNTFHRAYGELVKTLERDASNPESEPEPRLKPSPEPAPKAAVTPSPIEANPPVSARRRPAKTRPSTSVDALDSVDSTSLSPTRAA